MDQRNIYGQPTPMQGPWFSQAEDLGAVEPIPVEVSADLLAQKTPAPAVTAPVPPVEVVPAPIVATQVPAAPRPVSAEPYATNVPRMPPVFTAPAPAPVPVEPAYTAPATIEPTCPAPSFAPAPMEQKLPEKPIEEPEDGQSVPDIPVTPPQSPVQEHDPGDIGAQMPLEEDVPETFASEQPCPPKPAVPKKKRGKCLICGFAAVLAVLLLVVGSSAVTAVMLDARFQKKMQEMEDRIDELDLSVAEAGTANQGAVKPSNGTNNQNNNTAIGNTPVQIPDGQLLTPAQVYQMNLDSVVMIYNEIKGNRYTGDALYTGTGFVISEDGYVVTNYHVVEGDGELSVVTPSGQEYEAKLIGSNNANDVALLKVDGEGMQKVSLGDSDSLIVGDQVVAIGNPLGELTSTLTVGYISAKERDVNTSGFAINMLQTDAAINSGNSGGPLFNMRGEVIGITTAKYSGSSGSGASIEGIGFAIPINDVWDLIEDLMENGRETGPYLGVSVSDTENGVGVYVIEVVKGHCCYEAGLEEDDVILELDGREVNSVNELSRVLRSLEPGSKVEMKILRGDKELTLDVTLDEKPLEE